MEGDRANDLPPLAGRHLELLPLWVEERRGEEVNQQTTLSDIQAFSWKSDVIKSDFTAQWLEASDLILK